MPQDKFLIAPISNGLQKDLRPFLIMDDAFEKMQNAYTFRGRVRKRFGEESFGSSLLESRLRIQIGVLNGAHGLAVTVPGVIFGMGQAFSIDDEIIAVADTTIPIATLANGGLLDNGSSIPPFFFPCAAVSYNTTNGALVITGSAQPVGTPVYFYPASPVMGFGSYEMGTAINSEPVYAFDYQFAYKFTVGFGTAGWERSGTAVSPIWHGRDLDPFWTANWKGSGDTTAFFVSNFQVTNPNGPGAATDDPLWATQDGNTWNIFKPYFAPHGAAPQTGPYVVTARVILPFKDRLLLFNTIENDGVTNTNTWYPNRVRFSAVGDPFSVNAWYEWNVVDTAGNKGVGGSREDAYTNEAIVSVEYLKDRLIVYFENSTWELVYKENEVKPFAWQKINTELGATSTFSIVPFDKVVLGVDNVGIHACNGYNVERTDTKIPDQVFEMSNLPSGLSKVCGVRDYFTELVYWSYIDKASNAFWPNKILVYNYRNGSWAIFDDCITAFHNVSPQTGVTDITRVIAGDQQGFTFTVNADVYRNAPAMQISKMAPSVGGFIDLTIKDHNFVLDEYVAVENATGYTALNGKIFPIIAIVNSDTITIDTSLVPAGYTGGGTATRVSKIDILSKQYNPYLDKARNFAINKIDFAVEKTAAGKLMIDYYTASSTYPTVPNDGSLTGTNVLDTFPYPTIPFEALQTRLWHTIYFNTEGDCIQLHMYLSDSLDDNLTLIRNPAIAWSNFEMDGMLLYTQPTGRVS